jgi:cation diffusion facilitator CzcD-associated flavoprotein CzcO
MRAISDNERGAMRLNPKRTRQTLRIAIVGAGFGGLGMAIALRRAGFSAITVFERANRVGGTWRDNIYPGAACDVPSHLYSYSFALNPDWTRRYSAQSEILAYIEKVAAEAGVLDCVELNATVTAATFDEADGVWSVQTADGQRRAFDIFIPALGQLSTPTIPAFEGLASFKGPAFHSAAWNLEAPLKGRRVGVVGSAASAVQIVPELAPDCSQLTVFQRSASWLIPRNNIDYGPVARAMFKHVPFLQAGLRLGLYLTEEWLVYGALRTGSRRNRFLRSVALQHLKTQVKDPALRAKLTPDYILGCKRLLVSDDYLASFNRPNVALVTESIERIEPEGVRTRDGILHNLDALVFATGFDVRNCLSAIAVTGRDGQDLQTYWRDGPKAYRGVAAPGFPNMFMLYGPNTNLGHTSIIVMLEAQANYIVRCLERFVTAELDTMEVTDAATEAYNETLQRELSTTVWATGCRNWYGQGGLITANWPHTTAAYRRQMRQVRWEDFTTA